MVEIVIEKQSSLLVNEQQKPRVFVAGIGTSILHQKPTRPIYEQAIQPISEELENQLPRQQALRADSIPNATVARAEDEIVHLVLESSDPCSLSAEINTLKAMKPSPTENDEAILLVSDSIDGILAARIVRRVIIGLWKMKVISLLIPGLDLNRPDLLEAQGMFNLIRNAATSLAGRGDRAHVIATGGFKIVGSYLTMAGLLNGAQIHYLFQDSARAVALPRVRLRPDTDVWNRHFHLFLQLHDGEPITRVSFEQQIDERDRPELEPFLLWNESEATLSPLGQALIDHAHELHRDHHLKQVWRRSFLDHVLQSSIEKSPVIGGAVILADIDRFKTINDELGHDGGDEVLAAFTARLSKEANGNQPQGFIIRWGGEEFLIIIPNISRQRAIVRAEAMRLAIESQLFTVRNIQRTVTATFGIAFWPGDCEDFDPNKLRDIADQRLYRGKQNGRNQVVNSDDHLK